ncbi:hypothetical protein BC830DRAFT_1123951 [Chytriomyces sp. MP71]|nr:hypothetical protein BC830DRAFT_1123951 [Chytriomyces sp. MP71]
MHHTLLIALSIGVLGQLSQAFGAHCPEDSSAAFVHFLRHRSTNVSISLNLNQHQSCAKCVDYLPSLVSASSSFNSSSIGKKKKRKKHRRRSDSDNADLKVAIVGDFGLGKHPKKVLKMIDDWGAELTVMTGDFDYVDHPAAFMDLIDNSVGEDFPFVATPGNHDILKWYGKGGYRDRLMKRLEVVDGISCFGEYGVNMVCTWRGMVILLSGVGSLGQDHAEFVDATVANYNSAPWKICAWHKNQAKYQTGDKSDETGYEIYETCRRHGAIIATSHEHSYERTHLMSDFESTKIASKDNTLRIRPGETFALVSGLGGESLRIWQNAKYEALLCTFNKGGVTTKAHCKWQDVKGRIHDSFRIESTPGPASVEPRATRVTLHHEVGIASVTDILSQDTASGAITCGAVQLDLRAGVRHALRFHVPLALFDAARGDVLLRAHLQVMGAHSRGWTGDGFVKDSFRGMVRGIRVGGLVFGTVPSCSKGVVLTVQEGESGDLRRRTSSSVIEMGAERVEWTHEGEGWEAGEVWVSPDIGAVVREGLTEDFGEVVLVFEGTNSLEDEIRAVYGVHEEIGLCVSPNLVLEVERIV